MTYKELAEFIEHHMLMSHIYQPLLIRTLIDAGGSATVRQIAQAFLSQDESQLLHYEDTIKKMPVPVLSRHKVLKRDGQLVSLTVKKLTLEQKAHLRTLCEQRMQGYIQSRGLGIWDYRLLERDPVPDDLRYQVLTAGKGRCELCGATKDDRPLHVDHIHPAFPWRQEPNRESPSPLLEVQHDQRQQRRHRLSRECGGRGGTPTVRSVLTTSRGGS